ncbi:MAG: B12-binding domain-containing radical SAM protein [Actinomycetia bacterium]|nr:B12-binding domain-containing radical SAM protein [Actinomycetota bacterium]MCG2796210.1 B12-binding domain-containing radical SAM protein [Actinomycetes bacterium]
MRIHLVAPTKKGETYLFNKGLLAPLGLMYLAAYTPEEAEVRIIDENVERLDFSERPDLVGITTMTATAPRAYEIADRYRALGSKVVLGGVHASMLPEEALQHADSAVVGEAESIWPDVVADAGAGRLQPIYRQESFIDFKRPLPPRRDMVDPGRYWTANGIQTSRGCPHNCNFCSVTAFNGRRVRERDIDDVLAEVKSLPRSKITRRKAIAFVDDNIAAGRGRAKELFRALIPMKVIWGSQASITFADDEELVSLAAQSGCRFLFIGLETLSSGSIEEMGKRQNKVERYEEALGLLKRYGIQVMGAFIFGFDSDDESAFSRTLEFAMRNKIQVAQFANLTPYPGTRLYKRLQDEGRLEENFWFDTSWDDRVVFVPKNMSAGRLYRGTHQVHRDFYSYRSIIKRASLRKHWSVWFAFNLLYRQTVVASRSHAVGATEPAPKAT